MNAVIKQMNTEPAGQMPDLSYTVKDERLHIPLTVETPDGDIKLNLYFNPADTHIYSHINALENTPAFNIDKNAEYKDIVDEMSKFNEYVDYHFDEIFGANKAKEVFRYSGFKQFILNGLMERVKDGIEYFHEQAEAERKKREADSRAALAEQAKAESAAFIAQKK